MNERQKAYIAGILDGEGTITLSRSTHGKRKNDTYQIIVRVGSIDISLITFLQRTTKTGSIRYSKSTITGKPFYEWNALCLKGVYILQKVLPYMIIKRKHAKKLLWYQKNLGGIRPRKEFLETQKLREKFWLEFRQLNNKGKGFTIKINS